MSDITISPEEFNKFKEFFYRKTGIYFEETKRYFVDKRLIERIKETGSTSFRDYFTLLRFQASGEELQKLTNCMTVNETYFFREEHQFQCLVNSMLPDIIKKKERDKRIRIWSIPCSTGEEPYSIVIYLLEWWPELENWDVEIIASDIDTDVLQKAKAGLFSPRSVQHLPDHILKKYFKKKGNDLYQISQDLRNSVEFTRLNLNDPIETKAYRNFDVIYCRNLLIYFDDISRRHAAEIFFDALTPGGFICLGHSESMSRISSLFKVVKFPEAIVYQKSEVL